MLKWEKTFMLSLKRRGNIPRRVTPWWFMKSNWNKYFCNAWQKTWDTHSREQRSLFEKYFSLSFLWKTEISPTHFRNLKYDSGQEGPPRPTRPGEIIQQEIPKFDSCEQLVYWICNRRESIFHCRSPSGAQGRKAWSEKKSEMTPTRPNSREYSRTLKKLTAVFLLAKKIGSWPAVWGNTVAGTVLVAMELCDFCARILILPPPNLKKYDSCSSSFSVHPGIRCRNGGLVIARHN